VTIAAYILAETGGRFTEIAVILVIVVLAILNKVLQKAARKQQQAEAEHRRREQRESRPQGSAAPSPGRQLSDQAARHRAEVLASPPQAAPPAPPPPAPVARPAETATRRVGDELKHERLRMQQQELSRRKRLAVRRPSEADTASIEAAIMRIAPAKRSTGQQKGPVVTVHLTHAQQARRAIIFHEIFSPPKALRQGPEPWEL